ARAASSPPTSRGLSADPILDRNPFDHVTGPLRASDAGAVLPGDADPAAAPPCEGIRALVTVKASDEGASFAALDVRGRRVLRGSGSESEDLRVVFVGADRVWLLHDGKLCQARVFDSTPAARAEPAATAAGPLEKDIAGKIVRSGPNEFQI